ncbi:Dynein light chain type 1 family protein [Trichomonas vaginalis G3]|uniref:Dynein light chain n=1 Tax=Trichomonas vaginalis (strain ATCC PRA-98 / G3) TaxID=412133 RepID=A2EXV4_TRIV3|nr:positive regulation of ATP-dependent microtubule motor activity, plus-end-directed [Trichomonas vaginalis G3]EAY02487.1 Dynein light chain type 1 family protein [Trichomonas vaginalis G3]KAI5529063.1 positive regulation of ATP-dependent microtubule motor activity, plus-end-directed [Trichomonas vaginalis G3]|eukprot:XP_001314726.1 Dynein light chain type 1 family protein [Trichomonas vaginalis G3]
MSTQPAATNAQTGPTAEDRAMVNVVKTDCSEEVTNRIKAECQMCAQKFNTQREMAEYLKKTMDKQFGPTWNVIVGHHFASNLKHIAGNFVYLYIDQLGFLLFQAQ